MPDNVVLTTNSANAAQAKQSFPPTEQDRQRLEDYSYFEKLFFGQHFEAFRMRVSSDEYNKAYSQLRYVMVNFAGLTSKVIADMLFSEPITVRVPDGDQEFVEALIKENSLHIQWYESALENSYFGDALFKERTGRRHRNDKEDTVIIEGVTPRIYFPKIDSFNVRAMPDQQVLAWLFRKGENQYLRQEIHEPGKIINKVFLFKDNEIGMEMPLDILGIEGLMPEVETKVERSLLQHIPNWKVGSRWNGISDYFDLDTIFFAINNRMTKNDNVLDKHTDPILMVPPGVLDENGRPIKRDGRVIEMQSSEDGKPEYIVWDASLENAFKQIEKLVEFFYLIAEISPDMLGMGEGANESGRALKLKLLRTIAKAARKKLYYDKGIKESLYTAQLLAKAHGLKVGGLTLSKEPVMPEIDWADGLPIDEHEQIETETLAIDAGITTVEQSIQRVYKVDEETAKKTAKEVKDAKAIAMPTMGLGGNTAVDKNGKPIQKPVQKPATPPTKPPVK